MPKAHSTEKVTQSYLARKPLIARLLSVRAGEKLPGGWVVGKAGHVITGTLGNEKIQFFAHPDRAIEDFANTSDSPEDILYFTRRYGVLHRKSLDWSEQAGDLVGDSFFIHCGQWLESQKLFRAEWGRKGTPDDQLAQTLADQIPLEPSAGLFVKAAVRTHKRGFQLELQPDDLLAALLLAFLSFSDRTRKCQNPTCSTPYFLASRRDQKFCNEKCSRLVANRRWWDQSGAEWRRGRKKSSVKKSKGVK